MQTCSECDDYLYAKGLCKKHYMRLFRTGSTQLHEVQVKKCSKCGGPHKARGLCRKHYDEFLRTLPPKERGISALAQAVPHYKEVAKQLTPTQIAREFKLNPDTVRKTLRRVGIVPLRFCKKCQTNQPETDFENGDRRTCNRHQAPNKPKKYTEREWDNDMWQGVREDRALFDGFWMATEQGQPNGPYRAIDGGY